MNHYCKSGAQNQSMFMNGTEDQLNLMIQLQQLKWGREWKWKQKSRVGTWFYPSFVEWIEADLNAYVQHTSQEICVFQKANYEVLKKRKENYINNMHLENRFHNFFNSRKKYVPHTILS